MAINLRGLIFKSFILCLFYKVFTISLILSMVILFILVIALIRIYLINPEVPFFVKLLDFSFRIQKTLMGQYTGKFSLWRFKLVHNFYIMIGSGPPVFSEPKNTHIEKIHVPSLIDDKQIEMKVYIKNEYLNTEKKLPIMVYLFPGAFHVEISLVNKEHYLDMGFILVHISYRLAPEHKFPIPLEDTYSCLSYLSKTNHPIFKYWDSRIFLYGSSAGGNLAACSCLLMRDRGLNLNVVSQILEYPPFFYREKCKSHILYKNWYMHGENDIRYIDDMVIRSEQDYENQYLCPMKAKNFKGLPNAYFILAERDFFCSESEVYCEILKNSGIKAVCKIYPAEHGFMGSPLLVCKTAMNDLKVYLKERLEETKNNTF